MSIMFKKAGSIALIAAAVAPVGVSYAASTTLYGGGATLPAIAYVGSSFFSSPSSSRLTNPADAGSLFGVYSSLTGKPKVSYCQTGSGTGRKVLDGVQDASVACGSFVDGLSSRGFSSDSLIPSDANFAASDAPLAQSEITTFNTDKGATRVEPMQIPSLAGSIAIIYKNADVTTQLALTDAQICKIFSGQYTNWSQLGKPSKAITVVYRSDGSGTTFGFTNHESKVCAAFNGDHFATVSTFASGGIADSTGATVALPSNFVGESGNPAVVTEIDAVDGAIGYGEVADAVARDPNLGIAKVNNKDPRTNLATTYNLVSGSLLKDEVLGTDDPTTGRPTLVTTSPAPAHAGCVLIVNPDSYATSTLNYPIVAITYLDGYYAGNTVDKANLQALFKMPYNGTTKSKVTTVGKGTGFGWLGGTGVSTTVTGAVTSCIGS